MSQSLDTAKYDGMPRAAKHTGSVDLDLSPENIAKELMRFSAIPRDRRKLAPKAPLEVDPYEEILNILEREKGACFSQYKPSTVRRRIERVAAQPGHVRMEWRPANAEAAE